MTTAIALPHAPARVQGSRTRLLGWLDGPTLIPWVILVWLVLQVADSMFRFGFGSIGLPWGIYGRDLLCIGVLVWAASRALNSLALLAALATLTLGAAVGCVYLTGLGQVGFGLKMWLPFLAGLSLAFTPLRITRGVRIAVGGLFLVHVGLIFVNRWVTFPWAGFEYDLGDFAIQGNRQWWTTGDAVPRLSGWSRVSAEAATYCILLGAATCAMVRLPLRVIAWTLAGVAIFLTTTKGALFAWAVLSPFVVLGFGALQRDRTIARACNALIVAATVLMVAGPVFSIAGGSMPELGGGWLSSHTVNMRLEEQWPNVVRVLLEHGNPLLGRGVGGASTSVLRFEPNIYWCADSMFLYLYSQFGVIGALFPVLYCLAVVTSSLGIGWRVLALFILAYGVTQDIPELAVPSACLGYTWALATGRRIGERSRRDGGARSATLAALGMAGHR